jgi:dTDP-glucose 4,6-dehydratase
LAEVADRFTFIQGDISDSALVNRVFAEYSVDQVVHFAAESHVDNSIADPGVFVRTNILGTYTLIEAARNAWMVAPFKVRPEFETARFLHVSTDEVFGTLSESGTFSETSPYAPNSPYSATKAGSDFLVRSYFHTYGLNVVTTNCSNNYGPRQHDEKLIPTIIRSALGHRPIPIYGTGENIRDWLFVGDHCGAIQRVMDAGISGETYLIGSRNEWTNNRIVTAICKILDEKMPRSDGRTYSDQIAYVADRPGHDLRYAIDPSKIESELGWTAPTSFSDGLELTVDWYIRRFK